MSMLSAKEKWSYATGNIPIAVKDAAFANFVVFFYTQVHGLSGTLAGLAMFVALIWDAVSDPIVGSWSDTFRSRWGRRHPLLLVGGLPTALLFLALFAPPAGLGDVGTCIWLLCIAIALRTFLTIYFIPYTAMGAELSADYDERTVIAKARITVAWLAGMVLPALAYAVFFRPVDGVDGRLLQNNYWNYSVMSAAVAFLAVVVCVLGTRTVIPRLPVATKGRSFRWQDPVQDFLRALRNRNFKVSLGANLAFGMSAGLSATLALYLGTYFWELSSDQLAGLVVPTALAALMAFASLGQLGKRFDKAALLTAASLVLAFNALWLVGSRLLGWLPDNGHPLVYPLLWLNTFIGVFMIVSLQVIGASFAADVLDEIEDGSGQRQEGVVFAAQAFVLKATTGAGALLGGIVIDLAGVAPQAVPGQVDATVLHNLGLFALVMVAGLALIAAGCNRQLRLSRQDHSAIQMRLRGEQVGQRSLPPF